MDKNRIIELREGLDAVLQTVPNGNVESWFARDLMPLLGYTRWKNFESVVKKAITSFQTVGGNVSDHFRGVTKMVSLGSGAQREIADFMPTRYACYLIASRIETTCVVTQSREDAKGNLSLCGLAAWRKMDMEDAA